MEATATTVNPFICPVCGGFGQSQLVNESLTQFICECKVQWVVHYYNGKNNQVTVLFNPATQQYPRLISLAEQIVAVCNANKKILEHPIPVDYIETIISEIRNVLYASEK